MGRKLIDVPGYTFRVFVTSCSDPPQEIWRGYHRRADMENRIAELKHDLGADGFCMKQFFATEAAFRAVLLLFNLLAEFQRFQLLLDAQVVGNGKDAGNRVSLDAGDILVALACHNPLQRDVTILHNDVDGWHGLQ